MKLQAKLEAVAARYRLTVTYNPGSIELSAPDGSQFDTDLHHLVNAQQDGEPWPNVYRRAIEDAETFGPDVRLCPAECVCKE